MLARQNAAPHGRLRPIVTAAVVGAFALGTLIGFSLPRSVSGGSHLDGAPGSAAQARTFTGVADNNMTDAVQRTTYGPAAQARTFTGVADNNMTDAVQRATYGPAAAASASRKASHSRRAFHLTKTCVVVSSVKNQCEVTSSTFRGIPVGTLITYDTSAGPTAFVATITVKNGSATGRCDILAAINDATMAGRCTFKSGSGRLTQFHLTVAVTRSTTTDWNPWFWNGTYWFGSGH